MTKVISFVLAGLLLTACSEEESNKQIDSAAQTAKESVSGVQSLAKEASKTVSERTSELSTKAQEVVKTTVEDSKDLVQKAEVATKEVVETTKKTINEVAKDVASVTEVADNGKALYKACASCHGASGEKAALGRSKIIQAWPEQKVLNALKGYQDGSYGGAMKTLMKGQVIKLSDDELKALSHYISKL